MKGQILLITIFTLLFLLLFHFKKYNTKSKTFDIIQVDTKIPDYKIYLTENTPILFKNHSFEFLKKVVSPITIRKNLGVNTYNDYTIHYHDLLFIKSDTDCSLNILLPEQKKYFKKNKNKLTVINEKYNYSEILLPKDMIISVPRHWIFKINNNCKVSTFYTDTPFSLLFSKFF